MNTAKRHSAPLKWAERARFGGQKKILRELNATRFLLFSHENILTRSSSSPCPCFFKKPTITTAKKHHIKTISKLSRKRGFFIFIVTLEIIHESERKISTFIEFFSPCFSVSSRIAPKDGKQTTMKYKRAQRRVEDKTTSIFTYSISAFLGQFLSG